MSMTAQRFDTGVALNTAETAFLYAAGWVPYFTVGEKHEWLSPFPNGVILPQALAVDMQKYVDRGA